MNFSTAEMQKSRLQTQVLALREEMQKSRLQTQVLALREAKLHCQFINIYKLLLSNTTVTLSAGLEGN